MTLDFDCSLNMHELIDQVDPIKEIFQMTLLISPNPLMVKLLHKYLSV